MTISVHSYNSTGLFELGYQPGRSLLTRSNNEKLFSELSIVFVEEGRNQLLQNFRFQISVTFFNQEDSIPFEAVAHSRTQIGF